MKNKELQELLRKHNPEAEIIGGTWNGYAETYAIIDSIYPHTWGQIYDDFFGTPGRMDSRLFREDWKDDSPILLIDSKFGRFPNPEVDCGNDNIDYPITSLNEDPHLLWKMSGFSWNQGKGVWEKGDDQIYVSWMPETEILEIDNRRDLRSFSGVVSGIETLREVLKICKIPWTITI